MKHLRRICLLLLLAWAPLPGGAEEPPPACPDGMMPPGKDAPVVEADAVPREKRQPREQGQLVLYWPDEETAARELVKLERLGLRPAQQTRLGSLGGVIVLLKLDGSGDNAALRRRLQASLRGAAVDFNTRYYFEAGPRQYFARHIHLPAAPSGPVASVGIVDGPVTATPALKDVQIIRRSFLAPGELPSPDRHATAVASLIAGRDARFDFAGSAAGAPLFSAEIMRRSAGQDSTTTLALLQAIDWLLSQQVRVINLSLGGSGDALMARAFERLARLPVVIVAAAGNGGPEAPPSFPAAYPGVLAVTASNAAYEVYAQASRGSHIALTAPGEAVWTPDLEQGHYVSGTSFAAAQVSGGVARLLGATPGAAPASVRSQLCRVALDLGAPGPDRVFGCGLLQVAPLLNAGVLAVQP